MAVRPSPGLTQPRIRQGRLSQLRPDHHLSAARLPLGMRPNVMITETTFGGPKRPGASVVCKDAWGDDAVDPDLVLNHALPRLRRCIHYV